VRRTRRYRIIPVCFWRDSRFRALLPPQPSPQLLYLYLRLGPPSIALPGVAVVIPEAAAVELRWTASSTNKALQTLERAGLAQVDRPAGLIFLPGVARDDPPHNQDHARSWGRVLADEVPDCDLREVVRSELRAAAGPHAEAFEESFSETVDRTVLPTERTQCGHGVDIPTGNADREAEGQKRPARRFSPPTIDEVRNEVERSGFHFDPETFVAHYTANGWMQGGGRPLKDWRAACITWEKREVGRAPGAKLPGPSLRPPGVTKSPTGEFFTYKGDRYDRHPRWTERGPSGWYYTAGDNFGNGAGVRPDGTSMASQAKWNAEAFKKFYSEMGLPTPEISGDKQRGEM
jgi:hypothetical protein